jgi:hypothetical protein
MGASSYKNDSGKGGNMTKAHHEEIIAMLGSIAAVLAFGFGFEVAGWAFMAKAGLDILCSIKTAWKSREAQQIWAQAAIKKIAEENKPCP